MVDVLVKRVTPIENLKLLNEFTNRCGSGQGDLWLTKKEFISHINHKHHAMVPKKSQINKPAWIEPIDFLSDKYEILYCQTTEDLT